jgi:hypothetical protein
MKCSVRLKGETLAVTVIKKFLDQEKRGYLIVHAFKTLSLRGRKLAEASPERIATYNRQKLAKATFDKEVRALFISKKTNYSEHRIRDGVYFTEDFDLAEETRKIALKNGGEAFLFKVDSQSQRIK